MSSTKDRSSGQVRATRRAPRQARAEQRLVLILESAAAVIAEAGYEAATLTVIAARANTSIGSLYQYFPDKPAVARALATRFGKEISDRWVRLETASVGADLDGLIDRMLEVVLGFLKDFPAFLPLLNAAREYRHDPQERDRLRSHIAALLRAYRTGLEREDALCIANVVVEIIKSMGRALDGRTNRERDLITSEFDLVLKSYLGARLGERRDPSVLASGRQASVRKRADNVGDLTVRGRSGDGSESCSPSCSANGLVKA